MPCGRCGGGGWGSATPGLACVRLGETEGREETQGGESDEAFVEKGSKEYENNKMEEKALDLLKETKAERKVHKTKKHKKKTVLVRKI